MEYKKGDKIVSAVSCVCSGVRYGVGEEWLVDRVDTVYNIYYIRRESNHWALTMVELENNFSRPSKYPRIKTQFLGGLNEFL